MDELVEILARTRAATLIAISDLEDELAAIAESTGKGADDEHDPEGAVRSSKGPVIDFQIVLNNGRF